MAAKQTKKPGKKPARTKKTGKAAATTKRGKPAARDRARVAGTTAQPADAGTPGFEYDTDCPKYWPRISEPPKKRGVRKTGRPYVCIGPVRQKMIKNAWLGLHRETIAVQAGVSYDSMKRLMNDAKAAVRKRERGKRLTAWEEELCTFCVAFTQAEAGPLVTWTEIVTSCTDPKVVLEALGRRYPRLWGKRTLMANAPEEDEDGQPTTKKSALAVTVDPLTEELIAAELAARGDKGTSLIEGLPPPKNPHLLPGAAPKDGVDGKPS